MFTCEFCKNSKNTFSYRTSLVAASVSIFFKFYLQNICLGEAREVKYNLWTSIIFLRVPESNDKLISKSLNILIFLSIRQTKKKLIYWSLYVFRKGNKIQDFIVIESQYIEAASGGVL